MARSEARFTVSIWSPQQDFRDLTSDEQWMYFFLTTQADLAHDGVLPVRFGAWTQRARGLTRDQIILRLKGLEEARKVVYDPDTDEVLVRSLIRSDKVYRQPNVFRVALEHWRAVESGRIRAAIYAELLRIDDQNMPKESAILLADALAEGDGSSLAGGADREHPTPSGTPPNTPSTGGVSTPSGPPSNAPSVATQKELGVVTALSGEHSLLPRPSTIGLDPQNTCAADATPSESDGLFDLGSTRPPSKPAKPVRTKPRYTSAQIDEWFKRFYAAFPRKKNPAKARTTFAKVLNEPPYPDPETVIAGAVRYATERKGKPADYTKYPTTWLNGGCWDDEPDPPSEEELAAQEEARKAAVEAQILELRRTEPPCGHRWPAGASPHPTLGTPLCPECRAGVPPHDEEPQPETAPDVLAVANEYRVGAAAAKRRFDTTEFMRITAEATALLARGVSLPEILDVAESAGRAGTSLTEQRQARMGAPV